MKKTFIHINKIIQILLLFVLFFTGQKAFALHGQGDGHGGYVMVSDSGGGSSNDSGGGSGGGGNSGGENSGGESGGNQNSGAGGEGGQSGPQDNSGAEAQAQREAARAQKEGELNDAKNNSESLMNDISESNDQVATGDDSKSGDGTYADVNSNSEKNEEGAAADQNDSSAEQGQNQKKNANKLDSSDSDSTGDPVRITEGVYEQNETDLLFGNITSEGLRRKYRSDSKIISSFGYGWSTNLDQRIIRGTDITPVSYIARMEANVNYVKGAVDEYEQNLKEYYAVSSIENISEALNQRIATCDENLNSTALLYLYLFNLYQQAIGYDAEYPIFLLMVDVLNLQNRINEKKQKLTERLQTVEAKISEFNQLKVLYETKNNELQSYKDIAARESAVENKNAYAMFKGMENWYYQTGSNTITVIDEDGFPHLLFQENGNSEKWSNPEDRKILYCNKTSEGFELFEVDGRRKYFDEAGMIIRIIDRNDNTVSIQRKNDETISQVNTSYGESYSFEYQNGYIKKIINLRAPAENVLYTYDGNRLTGVTDTDGDTVTMNYDENNRLINLNKCDGSSICFEYGEQTADGKLLTTATINEEGKREQFIYDRTNRCTQYINHDGNSDFYYFNEKHKTIRIQKSDGNIIENTYDNSGNLICVKENGNAVTYTYDEKGNKISSTYTDGGSERWTYDSYNQVTSFTDCDGVYYEYRRDNKGNLLSYLRGGKTVFTQEFDIAGKLIKRTDFSDKKIITEYQYDRYGNLTEKKVVDSVTKYEYDSQNRVIKETLNGKVLCEYKYRGHLAERLDYTGLITSWLTNGRKDVTEYIQKDSLTGAVHKTRIEYDKRHLPVKVYYGDGETEILGSSYIYTAEGQLKSSVTYGNECWIKILNYKNGQVSQIKQFKTRQCDNASNKTAFTEAEINNLLAAAGENVFIQKYDIQIKNGNQKILSVTDGLGFVNLFEFDACGNLIKCVDANGETSQQRFSKAGRLAGTQSSFGGWYEYGCNSEGLQNRENEEGKNPVRKEYFADGKIKLRTDCFGKTTSYSYDNKGCLVCSSSEGKTLWYEYDDYDRIIKILVGPANEENSAVYFESREYSQNGRNLVLTRGGKYKTLIGFDAFGNIVKVTDGNGNEKKYSYNFLNQLTECFDGYGNKTSYDYNALGKVCRESFPDGSTTEYFYNHLGELEEIKDECGIVYSSTYDKAGRLTKEFTRGDSEKTYEYDKSGRITKVLCGGECVESYAYENNYRTITVKDGNGNNYLYNYDPFGRLAGEKNRNGITQNYLYDDEGKLKAQNNFDGTTTTIQYSENKSVRSVSFSDGTKNVFVYDSIGNIIEAYNEYGKTEYRYDKGGKLVYQKDVTTGEEIFFEYDDAGNRTKLLSSSRETKYSYGKNNEVKEIFDNKQRLSIKLDYDKNGREALRKFGNGTKEETLYDKAGRVSVKMQKSERGEIIWGQAYVYGADGKRSATVDHECRVTLYEYNKKGQLKSVYYPYSQALIDNLKKEASDNGLSVNVEAGENKYLSGTEKSALVTLLNSMQYGLAYKLSNLQLFIKESYVYDANGNRIEKVTPFGTISYVYDKENYLLSSGSKGQAFVNYTYDKMGNLLGEESSSKSVRYTYNSQNRLIYCEVTDHSEKTYAKTSYAYDAFGRRVLVQDAGEAALRTLYDGLTFDVIKQSPTFASGLFTDSYETGIHYGKTGRPTGERYRYIDDEEQKDGNRYFYLDDSSYKTVSTRYNGGRTQLMLNGYVAAQTTNDYGTEYFSTDLLGSVVNVTDGSGFSKCTYSYDAFGSLIQGDLSGSSDFGYLSNQHDPTSHLYNYGYRDYNPTLARFTTPDPIRDGPNWFTYCNGDPVNFVDLLGLEAGDNNRLMGENYYNIDYIKQNVPKQYQKAAIEALQKEESDGLYGPPTDSKRVTEGVGAETPLQKNHTGVDIGALEPGKKGDPIYATADGSVLRNGKTKNSGSTIVELSLPKTKNTAVYQHGDFIVQKGSTVKRGQIIGYMSDNGTPGNVHLHYEIRKDGEYAGTDSSKIENPLNHMPSSYTKE